MVSGSGRTRLSGGAIQPRRFLRAGPGRAAGLRRSRPLVSRGGRTGVRPATMEPGPVLPDRPRRAAKPVRSPQMVHPRGAPGRQDRATQSWFVLRLVEGSGGAGGGCRGNRVLTSGGDEAPAAPAGRWNRLTSKIPPAGGGSRAASFLRRRSPVWRTDTGGGVSETSHSLLHQLGQFGSGPAGVNDLGCQLPAFGDRSDFAGHKQGRPGIEQHRLASGTALGPVQNAPHDFRVLKFVAAAQILQRSRLQGKLLRRQDRNGKTALLIKLGK